MQVRAVVLTHEQCLAYRLPRAPIKESERRGARFEEQFGEGATELDALEALHPGALRNILVREIQRYWNPDHDAEIDRACQRFEAELQQVRDAVIAQYKHRLDNLEAALEGQREIIAAAYRRLHKMADEIAVGMFEQMQKELEARIPQFEPPVIEFEADEDTAPAQGLAGA